MNDLLIPSSKEWPLRKNDLGRKKNSLLDVNNVEFLKYMNYWILYNDENINSIKMDSHCFGKTGVF